MPNIPVYRDQASPSESSKPFIQDPGSVGLTEGAWQKSMVQLSKRAEEYQSEQDVLSASEALSRLNDRERPFHDEEFKRLGRNAVGAVTRGTEFYEQNINEVGAGLSGKAYKLYYQQSLQIRDSGLNRLSQHEAQQHQARKKDALETRVEEVRAKIRNGADQETIDRDVRQGPMSILSQIDSEWAGMDNTEIKNKIRDMIFGEYLDHVSVNNPTGIVDATQKWHGVMETDTLNKYLKKVDMANAITALHADPDKFKASDYASLDPVQQANLQQQAITLSESRLNKKIHMWEAAEKAAEKQLKVQQDNNEMAVLILQSQGRISIEDIQRMGLERKLKPDAVKYFMGKDQEGVNDPIIVGEIASMIEQKVDASDALRQAWLNKKIKSETFIQLKKQIGNDSYWKGMTIIRGALEPSIMDKWSEDKNLKWTEGFDYFNKLIAGGADPVNAAYEVLDGHYSKIHRTLSSMPRPKYWTGGESLIDQKAIGDTIRATADQFANGKISESVFQHEIGLLKQMNVTVLEELNRQRNQPAEVNQRKPESKRPAK